METQINPFLLGVLRAHAKTAADRLLSAMNTVVTLPGLTPIARQNAMQSILLARDNFVVMQETLKQMLGPEEPWHPKKERTEDGKNQSDEQHQRQCG